MKLKHKTLLVVLLAVAIIFLILSISVNYLYTGTIVPEKIVASIISEP
jgi:uncharacterized membrane protein